MLLRAFLLALTVSAVWAIPPPKRPFRRAPSLAVYDSCTQPNDIALTFDDGPYNYLRQISDAFTNAGAKATFFFNGNNWDCIYNSARISDIQYAYAAGHMIGSHTWSHADLNSLSTAQIQDAMYRMEEALSRIIGVLPGFMRPPYGDYNSNVQSIAFARNQNLALWDWDTGDADGNTTSQSEAVYRQITNSHLSNALVLEHETVATTANTLVPYAINLFQSNGYNLVTLAQCLGVSPYYKVGVPQTQSSSWTCNGTPDPGDACGGGIPCSTGTPTLSTTSGGPTATAKVIHPNGNTGMCLTAPTNTDGATVELDTCTGATSQKWTATSSGTLTVYNGAKCLDVTDGVAAAGTKMQVWTCTPPTNANQKWTIGTNTIQWTGQNYCLDNTDGLMSDGNRAQIWTCTGGANQRWQLADT